MGGGAGAGRGLGGGWRNRRCRRRRCAREVAACLTVPCLLAWCIRWNTAHHLLLSRRLPSRHLRALLQLHDPAPACLPLAGSCPISPLALPRRLIDGAVGTAGMVGTGPQKGLAGTVSGVALAVGGSEAYAAAGGGATPAEGKQQQQRSPMRKRIINLTAVADCLPLPAAWAGPRSATASPEPATSQQVLGGGGGSTRSPPAAQLPGLPAAATKSLHVLMSMHSLMSSNPALPVGLRSQLRASSPSVTPTADKKA